jgi:glycosyltransferase involved in cell wall biosynthesis
MKKIKISVLMPVFNGEKYVKEAIKSVLNQSFNSFEFIVVNDASTDKTEKIIKSFSDLRIKLVNNKKNLGVAGSLNMGLKKCQGEYIARVDADDVNLSKRLEIQSKFLDKNQKYVLVGSNAILIDQKGKQIGVKVYPEAHNELRYKMLIRNQILHPTIMMRTKTVKRIGGYRSWLNGAEDYDLFFRLMKVGKVMNLQQPLIKRRIHSEVVTQRNHLKIELLALACRAMNLKSVLYHS